MGALNKEIFVCLDCETTGLDLEKDRIIEVAVVRFDFDQVLDSFETLIDPEMPIPEASTAIHHITDLMVQGKPKVGEVLPKVFDFLGKSILIGHGIMTDITFLSNAAKRLSIPSKLSSHPYVDTLRLARLYGESPTNSLEMLRRHFNIAEEGAHRAMNDVIVNVEVFKYLARHFKTTEQMIERLKSPILLKAMPLGKYKGRPFSDISFEYLRWAAHQKFDQDLLFSIKMELKKRKRGTQFGQSTSPFANL
jgi:DNA polymerase III subunit epsilon